MRTQSQHLLTKPQATVPYYVDGNLSLRRFAQFLGASRAEVSKIIGRDPKTVDRDIASRRVLKDLQPLLYAMKMLFELAKPAEIKRWLHEPLIEWKGRAPMDELVRGNVEGFVNLVERIYHGEGGY